MSIFTGCSGKRYAVDYCGKKDSFTGAKNTYRAGEKVIVYYKNIATDTDYNFYLDGEKMARDYSDDKGFILEFTMPEHNVKISVESRNSSISDDYLEYKSQQTLSFRSFDGGGDEYSVLIEDESIVSVTREREYSKRNHEELDGAGYDEIFTLKGLKCGKTSFSLVCSSVLGESYEEKYDVIVNEALEIFVEKRESGK